MPFDHTLGVLEIGIVISGILFGMVTTQVYVYHKNFPKDSLLLKIGLVDALWLIEFGHTVCITHALYDYTVSHYGDPKELLLAPKSLGVAVLFHGIATVMVQAFFTYRIVQFSKVEIDQNVTHTLAWVNLLPLIIPIVSSILMLTQLIAVTVLSAEALIVATKSLVLYLEKWEWLLTTALVLRSAADILISGALVWFLIGERSGAYKKTVQVVDKLIQWAIETGIITSMLGIIILITYHTNRQNFAWLALFMVLPKVFSNTLLANMNSRAHLRDMQSSYAVSSSSAPSSTPSARVGTFRARMGTGGDSNVAVTVVTQSDSEMDTFDIGRGWGRDQDIKSGFESPKIPESV
ncbi:hypothetical protein K435DRAFT_970778 [Dendrothele bispora CBS 962.96]|uniref:DUF6534 domain-containing protein n=1 Tax=Dendrothele bispora (strain CBS 962.96) TaxID=1314807 RepID=A0A4S8L958_DENBC|nr:hypothetical protein K435DRAFT_970778 [Dendrothele bispora CBS 962.96]